MESKQPSPFFYSSAPHCLREKKQEILARWETRARAKLASASRTNHFVLLDSLPAFLDQLSNSLEQRTPRVVEMKNVAEAHAIQRASLEDYNLEQVQSEYNILRQVIFEVLDENNMVDVRERNIILDSIADGHIAAANEYMRIAHQRVQLSEERLSLALESAQMGTFEWNIKDGSLYWSDTLIKLSGLGPDEFTGRIDDFWKQILPNDLASVQDAIRKSLENRGDYLAEFRVAWPDKTVHWILARGRTYFDKDNQPERMLGTGVDITERKALEESLKLSNKAIENDRAWLEMVLNSIPIPTFLLDAQERKIAFENESSKNLTFMIPREFTPEMSDRFYAVDSKGNLIKTEDLPRHRVARGEEVKDFEMTWHTPRGSVSLLISGKRLPAAYGHPPICVLSLRDITELKRIEAGLKESEAKFKLLYESELIGIVFGDIGGGMHEMNDYFLSLIGYTREDVIQNHVNWLQLTPPEYLHLDEKAIAEMNRTGRCTPYEKPFIRKDGSWVWIMLTAIFMDESHFKHVAIVIDITERKLELERERELREQFVNTLSHDLRNPLSAAKTTAQLISRSPNRVDRIPNLVGRIGDSLTRAEKMIEDLLDANRIRAGKGLPIVREETNLVEIANEVCAELATVYGDRFQKTFPREIVGKWSSKNLYRLLENLLSNAIKYGYSHTPIMVTLEDYEGSAHILVHNFGEAIPLDEQSNLFNPFMRSKSVDLGKKKGWGLGLTLVKGVAEAHGGSVSVYSDPKEGTTFRVHLPKDNLSKS